MAIDISLYVQWSVFVAGMSKLTNGLSKKDSPGGTSSPRRRPPKLSKPSVSELEVDKSPNHTADRKKTLSNGCAKSNSFDVREKKDAEDITKNIVYVNGNSMCQDLPIMPNISL